MNDLQHLIAGYGINLIGAILIIRFIYYSERTSKNFVISLFAFNSIMFFMMRVMSSNEVGVGAGFGLFAVLSILRYRTNAIPIRDMTYLLVLVVLPIINSSFDFMLNWYQILIPNIVVILLLFILEKGWGFEYEQSKRIFYERIDLIRADNHALLLADLKERTGLEIVRVEIGDIDFLKDSAELKIYYFSSTDANSPIQNRELHSPS